MMSGREMGQGDNEPVPPVPSPTLPGKKKNPLREAKGQEKDWDWILEGVCFISNPPACL